MEKLEKLIKKHELLHNLIKSSSAKTSEKEEIYHLLKKLEKLAEELAMYDKLTRIPNYDSLCVTLNKEISRAKRHKHPLSVMMVDIDDFKPYNDTYGHEQGNEALIQIAKTLDTRTRQEDIVARYGGEEFTILFPELSTEMAFKAGEKLRSIVESTDIVQYVGNPNARDKKYSGEKGFKNLTISIGITTYPSITNKPELLIKHADQAMYLAKESGKNTVKIYSPGVIIKYK